MKMTLPRRTALVLGTIDVLTAALVVFGVFMALPARWWPVDCVAAALAGLEVVSAIGLFAGAVWAVWVARVAAAVALGIGLLAVSVLAVTASWLGGVYGPVGRGGSIVLALTAALALPYLVGLPILQLLSLAPSAERGQAPSERS
jgi:hypothetical protein